MDGAEQIETTEAERDLQERIREYEEKVHARLERLQNRAASKRAEGEGAIEGAMKQAQRIPFGQPILVGHHSEARDRRFRARLDARFTKGMEALKEASELERRASAAARNTAISSDDPQAITKLREKLAKITAFRELAKKVNAIIRSAERKGGAWQDVARPKLIALGLSEGIANDYMKPDFAGRLGIPGYKLQLENANGKRIEARIKVLEAEAARAPAEEVEVNGVRMEEGDNRIRLVFPDKPSEKVRDLLKARGFRWSPRANAWQRQLTEAGRYAAKDILRVLPELS